MMFDFLKKLLPRRIVGIDIGSFAVKITELSQWGKTTTLENYAYVKLSSVLKELSPNTRRRETVLAGDLAAAVIKKMLDEAKIRTKTAIFSVPDFSTFCTSFDLPPMTEKEIPGAIFYNASRHIAVPVSEVTLDWRVISDAGADGKSPLKVFLVAVSNQVVQEYKTIAGAAGLELYALEGEVFGISRALVKDNKKTICLVDVGAQSSTLNIIDKNLLKRSYSFNFPSSQLSENVSFTFLAESLLEEIKSISADFFQSEQKQVEEIYLTGGGANLPGLKEHIAKTLNKNVSVPDCFSGILYPPALRESLLEIGPGFSAAVGVALDGLDI